MKHTLNFSLYFLLTLSWLFLFTHSVVAEPCSGATPNATCGDKKVGESSVIIQETEKSVFSNLFDFNSEQYVPLEKSLFPDGAEKNFTSLVVLLIDFAIKFGGILAVIWFAWGAFNYLFWSSGNTSKTQEAKDIMFNSLFGLVLLLMSYVILNEINPILTQITLY